MTARAAARRGDGGKRWASGGVPAGIPSLILSRSRMTARQSFERERIMKLSNVYSATCHHWYESLRRLAMES